MVYTKLKKFFGGKKMKITKDMLLIDAFRMGNQEKMAEVLQSFGMHCLGCALAHGETIEQAAASHGVDAQEMVDSLNAVLDK